MEEVECCLDLSDEELTRPRKYRKMEPQHFLSQPPIDIDLKKDPKQYKFRSLRNKVLMLNFLNSSSEIYLKWSVAYLRLAENSNSKKLYKYAHKQYDEQYLESESLIEEFQKAIARNLKHD